MPHITKVLILFAALLSVSHAAPRPNIVLILVDDMGYSDLGCFGSEIETPNLDRLAADGIRFTNFTNNAKCETTRTALMTGQYHTVVRQKGNGQRVMTLPETLALGGYQSFMVGKWHILDQPMQRGFERYFGFHEGATNFFNGEGTRGGYSYFLDEAPYQMPDDFYSTDAFTSYAIQFVKARDTEKPFFLYVAYNAPHYPLQAPEKDVMKYRGRYLTGWDQLREARFQRMQALGIVSTNSRLSQPEPKNRKWDNLSPAQQDHMDLRMATYAAMIDIVDQQVGRLVETLKTENIFENTLILFVSDNGACPFDRTRESTLANNYMPWDARSYYCYTPEWANACNTPFRLYKQNQNEGGIAAPMIAHWPNGIQVPGSFNRQRGHVRDFHATFRELAGVTLPSEYKGQALLDSDPSISFTPAFVGKNPPQQPYYYQYFKNGKSALIIGKWKLVDTQFLYDLSNDRIESNDLSRSHPEQFQTMLTEWQRRHGELNPSAK
ncbi:MULTISPECIES: arylsulfatase [unclassified Lentimonas]|uniref:arylsulfatase n=1 Tax=unclassified Lentimonas TaxID=2630993 RepID=UPI0013262E7B|nr:MULTISPECIES: arylsulfatase [unclassified Lentimonas]CAA6693210.1 Choline-sulfatase (EC [Lentimonas sp. CC10]CAA6695499.1 Choline-sulfatase (EC [Lentimonas sp. CC19]CAA7071735.1 Choline-sulfatase (EC [Lentimonas sp. CC11]